MASTALRLERLALALALSLLAGQAGSALYRWVDDKGRVQYSDKPPAEANKGGVEMSNRGVVKKKLDGGMTADEKKLQAEEAERKRAEQQEAIAQRRADNALLQSFTTVKEIDMKRDRELQAIDLQLASLRGQEKSILERYNEDRRRAENLAKGGKPLSDSMKEDLTRSESEVKTVREEIQRKSQDASDTRLKYEAMRKRYLELKPVETSSTPAAAQTAPAPAAVRK